MPKWPVHLCILALSGCSTCVDEQGEERPWNFEESGPDEPDDPGEQPDSGAPPSPDDPGTCVEASIHYYELQFMEDGTTPMVSGDRVFALDERRDIVELIDGEPRYLTGSPTTEERLVAADDRYLWYTNEQVLFSRDLRSGETVSILFEGPVAAWWLDSYSLGRQQAWGGSLVGRTHQGAFLWTREEAQIALDPAGRELWMGPDGVVWTVVADAFQRIYWRPGDGETHEFVTDEPYVGWPVAAAGRLFYVNGRQVMMVDDSGAGVEVLGSACGPLTTDGETIMTACNPAPEDGQGPWDGYLTLNATEIWAIDAASGESERIHVTADSVHGPTFNARWVAWIEYSPPSGETPARLGRVMVRARGGGEVAQLAEMGEGCPYCGAIWAPPRLDLGDDTVAWNYAVIPSEQNDNETPGFPMGLGVAHLTCSR